MIEGSEVLRYVTYKYLDMSNKINIDQTRVIYCVLFSILHTQMQALENVFRHLQ